MTHLGRTLLLVMVIAFFVLCGSCKKCITCTARDSHNGEVKFSEKSCAKGPLLDDWQEGIKQAYPEPGYNTVCQ